MSPWERLLEKPPACGHLVQLYHSGGAECSLVNNVGLYISEGLKRREGALVIATQAHWEAFTQELHRLDCVPQPAIGERRLVFLDAEQTLERFLVAGQPNWERFEIAIGAGLRLLQPQEHLVGIRAYGEMVGLLWNARQFSAAIRLEQFWNKLLARVSFSLYCAYSIDPHDQESHAAMLDRVLSTHSHVIPSYSSTFERELFSPDVAFSPHLPLHSSSPGMSR